MVDQLFASGLDYLNFDQGGVVVGGVAYFTGDGTTIGAFDPKTFQLLRTYSVGGHTYDSSPLVFPENPTIDNTWLVIAHDIDHSRTIAMNRDTGATVWTSAANQPGSYFFGYSYYQRTDGSRLILAANTNGLHAMSSQTGQDVWSVPATSTGGITPAVDQTNGWIFYQHDGQLLKVNAANGSVLTTANVTSGQNGASTCISWNTVLVKGTDAAHSYVGTYWYDSNYHAAIRVYDENLNLKWQQTGLATGKKHTLTYADGLLLTGSGDGWVTYPGSDWKHITAYNVADGTTAWTCDLSAYNFQCIENAPYYNGYFYAQTDEDHDLYPSSFVFRINASTGKVDEVFDYGHTVNACATCIIADGNMFKGAIWEDRTTVLQLATGSSLDWVGPFGDPQLNQMAVSDPGATLVSMRELVPEPSMVVLLLTGLIGLLCYAWRKRTAR